MNPEELKEGAEELQANIPGAAENLKDKAAQMQQTITGTTDFARATDTYVRTNPWVAIGVVAAAAFALGLLVGSPRR